MRGATTAIIEERRPVELTNLYAGRGAGRRARPPPAHVRPGPGRASCGPTPRRRGSTPAAPAAAAAPGRTGGRAAAAGCSRRAGSSSSSCSPSERMLPAIALHLQPGRLRRGRRAVPRRRAAAHHLRRAAETAAHRRAPDDRAERRGPRRRSATTSGGPGSRPGSRAHHAGLVPPMKEAVEEAFAAGLVKVVFATETLSLGINMPARSVVIEKLSKFTGEHHEFLTPGEYTQLTGRAGRRGIDDVGLRGRLLEPVRALRPGRRARVAPHRTRCTSSFRPTYNMAANLVARYPAETAHHLLNLSFAQYRADRDVVALERAARAQPGAPRRASGRRRRCELRRHRGVPASCSRPRRRAASAAPDGGARSPTRSTRCARATCSSCGRGGGRVVVLKHEGGRRRLAGAGAQRRAADVFRLGPGGLRRAARAGRPHRAARALRAAQPGLPAHVVAAMRRAAVRERRRRGPRDDRRDAEDRGARRRAPGRAVPGARRCTCRRRPRSSGSSATSTRLERRVRGRSESLARQFDRVLGVLESWGYVDGWALTDAGRAPRPAVLRVRPAARGVAPRRPARRARRRPSSPRVVSCFTYERRGPDGDAPAAAAALAEQPGRASAAGRSSGSGGISAANEDDAGCPRPGRPTPGSRSTLHAWAGGDDLADVLDDDELTGGDFVRNVKQASTCSARSATSRPSPQTAATAPARAAEACFRGVVAASSVAPPRDPRRARPWGRPGEPGRGRPRGARRRRATWPRVLVTDHRGALRCGSAPAPASDLAARRRRSAPTSGRGRPSCPCDAAASSTWSTTTATAVRRQQGRARDAAGPAAGDGTDARHVTVTVDGATVATARRDDRRDRERPVPRRPRRRPAGPPRATAGSRCRSTRSPAASAGRCAPGCRRGSTCPHPRITTSDAAAASRSTSSAAACPLEVDGAAPAPSPT